MAISDGLIAGSWLFNDLIKSQELKRFSGEPGEELIKRLDRGRRAMREEEGKKERKKKMKGSVRV